MTSKKDTPAETTPAETTPAETPEQAAETTEARKQGTINLFKFRTLSMAQSCEAQHMGLKAGQPILDPAGEEIAKVADVQARWVSVQDSDGKIWSGLDDFSLALQGQPRDSKGRYSKRKVINGIDKPVKHGFAYCTVKVFLDEAGKPTSELVE